MMFLSLLLILLRDLSVCPGGVVLRTALRDAWSVAQPVGVHPAAGSQATLGHLNRMRREPKRTHNEPVANIKEPTANTRGTCSEHAGNVQRRYKQVTTRMRGVDDLQEARNEKGKTKKG